MFQKIAHDRSADAVVRQIERLILDGVLRPGDRLPPERELAQAVDVSRPILRAALKELEARGLIRARHGEGTYVADVIGTVFEPPMVELVRRHQRAIFDYLEFRRDIEGTAAAYAAERATEADLTIIDRIFGLMVEAHAIADPEEEARLDVEFHTAIIEAAHNVVLLHMMRSCYRLLAEGVFYNRQKIYANATWRDDLLNQHRAIHDAIKGGDRDAAQGAARAHMDFVEIALHSVDRTDARTEISELRLQKFTRAAARQRA